MLTKKNRYFRSISGLLIITMLNYSLIPVSRAMAESKLSMSFEDAAKAGSDMGKIGVGEFKMPTDNGNNTYSIDGIDEPININEIFPGVNEVNANDLKNMTGDDKAIMNQGIKQQHELNNSDSSDPFKQAYDTAKESFNNKKVDMSNDKFWEQTDDVFSRLNELAKEFSDCSVEQTFVQGGKKTEHVPIYKQCDRQAGFDGQLKILHDYSVGVVVHEDGPMNLTSCGEGCVKMWVGTVGDNYWSGSCKIYEESMSVKILNPSAIKKAVLEHSAFDDYHQVWINGVKVYNGPNENFPPETEGACELGTNWRVNPNIDVTKNLRDVEPDTVIQMQTRTSVTGRGEGYSRIRIEYDPQMVVSQDRWYPDDDFAKATEVVKSVQDGWCQGSWKCDKMPSDINDKGCTEVNGFFVCEDNFPNLSPFPGVSNFCTQVSLDSQCSFTQGEVCWKNINGEEVCSDTGDIKDTCKPLQENPECGYIKSECVGNASGDSGKCYVFEDTYDCGYDVEIDDGSQIKEDLVCEGGIQCLDGNCVDKPSDGDNLHFAEAVAMLQVLQYAGKDMECADGDEQNITCSIFNPVIENDKSFCKIAVGGMQNCCEAPEGVGIGDYLTMISTSMKIEAFIAQENWLSSDAYQGVWSFMKEGMKEGIKATADYIASNFSSLSDIATGVSETMSKEASKSLVAEFQQQMMTQAYDYLAQVFGEQAAGMFITSSTTVNPSTGATETVMSAGPASTALMYVYYAYLAYVIFNLLVNIIWECTEEELQLSSQVELQSCHYLGSYCASKALGACVEKRKAYCCYTSPLARIMNEQARLQLGDLTWGDPEHPQCQGLPMNRLDDIDWAKVNLDEWIGIQVKNNIFPEPAKENVESLTGNGSAMNIDGGDRDNVVDRNLKKTQGVNFDKDRSDIYDDVHSSYIER